MYPIASAWKKAWLTSVMVPNTFTTMRLEISRGTKVTCINEDVFTMLEGEIKVRVKGSDDAAGISTVAWPLVESLLA